MSALPLAAPQRIWKYPVPLTADKHILDIPWDAQFLTVQVQHGEPMLWALVSPDAHKVKWHLHWVGTGHEVAHDVTVTDGRDKYIGTIQVQFGALVFHLFHSGHEEQDRNDW